MATGLAITRHIGPHYQAVDWLELHGWLISNTTHPAGPNTYEILPNGDLDVASGWVQSRVRHGDWLVLLYGYFYVARTIDELRETTQRYISRQKQGL